jgi:hypothetical protein
LVGGVAVIKVGAVTEAALQEKKARLEDALHATRAAVEEGVVPGGGLAYIRALPALEQLQLAGDRQVGVTIITRALVSLCSVRILSMHIFVDNLSYTVTEDALRQLFEPYGAVDKVDILTDRDTGRAQGVGFIEMPDRRAAQAAMQGLQGKHLAGRALNLNEAKPREPRRAPRQARW